MKTLFIGNSHTYFNDMPDIYRKLCRQHGINMDVAMLALGGMGLDYHARQPQTRFNILFGGYDVVILQHTAHPMGDLDKMREGIDVILQWIHEAGSRPILYQTWAQKGNEDFQPVMSSVYNDLGRRLNVEVAPVGDVWQQTRRNPSSAELFYSDGEHASPAGSALAARVIFETVFPEACEHI